MVDCDIITSHNLLSSVGKLKTRQLTEVSIPPFTPGKICTVIP